MPNHKIRRLPLIGGHRLAGMVALADAARALPDPQVGKLLFRGTSRASCTAHHFRSPRARRRSGV
ncbi:CBS domain-containing protein [Streptomyces mirabilis]|uniref:hypothetical protein n=1 Tax=Streptomyces mirabilis TaxID=68239 RepID=UPI0036A6A2D5